MSLIINLKHQLYFKEREIMNVRKPKVKIKKYGVVIINNPYPKLYCNRSVVQLSARTRS